MLWQAVTLNRKIQRNLGSFQHVVILGFYCVSQGVSQISVVLKP
jgi:hypothetical protein